MKKPLIALVLTASILSSSCLGEFKAFNNLKDWNKGVSDSKFVNNAIFWGFFIIPVYPLFFLGDLIIFNVIEFWSGSNPIAMQAGDIENQFVEKNGVKYQLTATQNHFTVAVLSGEKQGKKVNMYYLPEEKTWYAENPNGADVKLSKFEDGFYMVSLPNGQAVAVPQGSTYQEGMELINAKLHQKTDYYWVQDAPNGVSAK
ncbi:MAG: hypothetical protein CVT96_01130 [Bacteroidetes bacterium HGW-Bacteroidetes-13]|nr:MAG: hypothetical protein CVT96_01130 [Bacteroidetes bacterium HGW-Bacteroidetes-13]